MKNQPQYSLFFLFTLILIFFSSCDSQVEQVADTIKEVATEPVSTSDCIEPPLELPFTWSSNIYPNCYTNLERLGRWIGGDAAVLTPTTDPQKYFAPVLPGSVNGSDPVHLYVVVHGWAPGLRAAVNNAKGKLKWWSSGATYKGAWESAWAWTPTTGTRHDNLQVSPTGLLQQIEKYEKANGNGAKSVVLAYSWVDDSATPMVKGGDDNTWDRAAHSEAYTNLNGLRLADAIRSVVNFEVVQNPDSKIHLIGHSHGTKVVTVAALELLNKGITVDRLSVFDSPETEVTLASNSANLLGFYFDKLPIAPINNPTEDGKIFVENYYSMFGDRYKGPAGSPINNIVQTGLNSEGIFGVTGLSERHAYAATWYSNAWNATNSNSWPLAGLGWPPVVPDTQADYYQEFSDNPFGHSWKYQQWHLYHDFTVLKKTLYTNPALAISTIGQSKYISGSTAPDSILNIPASKDGITYNLSYAAMFDAQIDDLYGVSFEIQWNHAQTEDYVVVTVQTPAVLNCHQDQEVALVFDSSSKMENDEWHHVSFNTYAPPGDRDKTQFEIHYYPAKDIEYHPGVVSFKNFRYIKEKVSL